MLYIPPNFHPRRRSGQDGAVVTEVRHCAIDMEPMEDPAESVSPDLFAASEPPSPARPIDEVKYNRFHSAPAHLKTNCSRRKRGCRLVQSIPFRSGSFENQLLSKEEEVSLDSATPVETDAAWRGVPLSSMASLFQDSRELGDLTLADPSHSVHFQVSRFPFLSIFPLFNCSIKIPLILLDQNLLFHVSFTPLNGADHETSFTLDIVEEPLFFDATPDSSERGAGADPAPGLLRGPLGRPPRQDALLAVQHLPRHRRGSSAQIKSQCPTGETSQLLGSCWVGSLIYRFTLVSFGGGKSADPLIT